MGIKNLNHVIKKNLKNDIKKIYINNIASSIVGIDFSLFLYRFIYNKSNPIECFLRQILMFFKHNILPVYVLDGKAPDEKKFIIEQRNYRKEKIIDEIHILEMKLMSATNEYEKMQYQDNINKLKKKYVVFSDNIISKITKFFDILGIPYIRNQNESDWLLSNLSKENIIDYILSEDSDMLAFGGKKILRNFSIREESFLLYDLDTILYDLEINHHQLVDICILCGCDYIKKITGYNCTKSFSIIKKHKTIENFIISNDEDKNVEIDLAKINNIRNIFLKKFEAEDIAQYHNIIFKKSTNYINLETFLNNNLEISKKGLITIFIDVCKNFIHYKSKKTSVLTNLWSKNITEDRTAK